MENKNTQTCNSAALREDESKEMEEAAKRESGGTVQLEDAGYVTNDDVMDSIAEGYF